MLTVHGRDCHHPVVKRVTALVARRAAAVVAVSQELAAQCPFPVAAVIPPGVDLELFRPLPRAEARARLGLAADAEHRLRLLVFPADPARPEKRYAAALELAARLAARRPGVELRPVFGRPRAEMPLWCNAADAVLVTSEREGYGLACVEALACEVPVLSTPVGIAPSRRPPPPPASSLSLPAVDMSSPVEWTSEPISKHVLVRAEPDVRIGDRHAVDEAGALLPDVEARNVRAGRAARCTNTPVPGKLKSGDSVA